LKLAGQTPAAAPAEPAAAAEPEGFGDEPAAEPDAQSTSDDKPFAEARMIIFFIKFVFDLILNLMVEVY